MINIFFHKNIEKQYKKLSLEMQIKFKERLSVFISDEFSPILNNHPLKGKYKGYRSINISGDLRAIYKTDKKNRVFVVLGSHNNLYK